MILIGLIYAWLNKTVSIPVFTISQNDILQVDIKGLYIEEHFKTDSFILYGANGEERTVRGGKIYRRGDNAFFTEAQKQELMIEGIGIDPTKGCITDLYQDTLLALENDIPLMILFIDGLSYISYEKSSFSRYPAIRSRSVYEPVTNAGFAAMITGLTPEYNGVHNREERQYKGASLFEEALIRGKEAVLLEGNATILQTEIEPYLHIDKDDNGLCDDELYLTAKEMTEIKPDLVMVHFHSVDDYGHRYGPYASETVAQIEQVYEWSQELVSHWEGQIIILADHGMHTKIYPEVGGNHGMLRYEDMYVPYIRLRGNEYEHEE